MAEYAKLNTIRKAIQHGMNVLVIGPHGIGKTEAIRHLVETEFPQFKCVYTSVSQIHKADILAPFPTEKHGRRWMTYIPHDMFDSFDERDNTHKPIVLILDEFNRNLEEPDIYNALLEVMRSHSLCGVPLNIQSIIGLANPDKDGRYFNTSPLEITVLDRFQLKLRVDMYDLGADQYLLEKYPDHAPAVMEWVLTLPEDKRWMVPPRTQESIIQVHLMGEPVRYVFTEDVSLPISQLQEALKSGNVWTFKRLLQDPKGAASTIEGNSVMIPLFVSLLRLVRKKSDAMKLQPVLRVLPEAIRLGLWRHRPEVWTDAITQIGELREIQDERAH
ncbi:MAG: hypothetical protein KatS3mg023_3643 [Armatimonadota bacterium]|nr:MAG: hypothetical protein KatS3mg023_3643 [Armatimonadota bacterium]